MICKKSLGNISTENDSLATGFQRTYPIMTKFILVDGFWFGAMFSILKLLFETENYLSPEFI